MKKTNQELLNKAIEEIKTGASVSATMRKLGIAPTPRNWDYLRPYRVYDQDKSDAEILCLYCEGVGAYEIAKRKGLSHMAVYNALHRRGGLAKRPKKIPEQIRSEIRALRASGLTQRAIAQRLNTTEVTVRKIMKEAV